MPPNKPIVIEILNASTLFDRKMLASLPSGTESLTLAEAAKESGLQAATLRVLLNKGLEGARIAIGQTRAGRYLRVIYVADPEPESVFCITAYDLGPKALHALRRRRRK